MRSKRRKGSTGCKEASTGRKGSRGFLCLLCLVCLFCLPSLAQTPATTTVRDTVYKSDGSLASGTVVITWQAFVTADDRPVLGGTKTVPLTNGAFAVALAPNSGSTPSGTSYAVKYYQSGGLFFAETWVVPRSSPLASPGAPTVTNVGTSGSKTYYYWVTATNANGETLLSSSGLTTTSNATLDTNNYNQITWGAVSGATGYNVYRTNTATAPSGTGSYLVGSTATTSINDQSNNLASATIPALNTTDPRTLSQVRVTAAPSPTVTLAASQVTGTSIVSNPSSTQSIGAPPKAGVIPLQIKGNANDGANLFEIYDSQSQPALQSWFDSSGAFKTSKAPTFSTTAAGSVLFGGTGGLLSQDNTNLFWDNTSKRLGIGTSAPNYKLEVEAAADDIGLYLDNAGENAAGGVLGINGTAEGNNASGTKPYVIGSEGDAHQFGAGTVTDLEGVAGYTEVHAGTATNAAAIHAYSVVKSGGSAVNVYGVRVDDQNVAGSNNFAIKTGLGKVQFGDDVVANKSVAAKTIGAVRFAGQFAGADAGAKIAAAIADLPSTGGTVDARGLEGAQTISSTISCNKPVILLFGAASYTVSAAPGFQLTDSCSLIGLKPDSTTFSQTGAAFFVDVAASTKVDYVRLEGFLVSLGANALGGIRHQRTSQAYNKSVTSERWQVRNLKITGASPVSATGQIGLSITQMAESLFENVWVFSVDKGMLFDRENVNQVVLARAQSYYSYGITFTGQNDAGDSFNSWSNSTIVSADLLGPGVDNTSAYALILDSPGIRNLSPFYEMQHDAAGYIKIEADPTGNTKGGNEYVELGGMYAVAPLTVTLTNTILVQEGHQHIIFQGCTLGAGYTYPPVSVGAPFSGNGTAIQLTGNSANFSDLFKDIPLGRAVIVGMAEDAPGQLELQASQINYRTQSGTNPATMRLSSAADQKLDLAAPYNSSSSAVVKSEYGLDLIARTAYPINLKTSDTTRLTVNADGTVDFLKAARNNLVSVTFSATPTFDASQGNSFKMALTDNVTNSTISNAQTGEFITFLLCQDGTGNRTMTWPTTFKLAGGSFTLTTTANKCDSLTAVYDGTNWVETARSTNL